MNLPQMARALVYAGTLPFIALMLTSAGWLPNPLIAPFDTLRWGMAYSAVILSFITGIHWMLAIDAKNLTAPQAKWLLLNSNIMALWAWGMWGLQENAMSWLGMALGFVWMLWLEARTLQRSGPWAWFWPLRWQATSIATISLVITGLSQLNQAWP
jgi:hypothetical protein